MAVGMLSFLYYWNDFINPLLYLRSQSLFTPGWFAPTQEMDKTNGALLMAASTVMTVPAVIVFFVLQRPPRVGQRKLEYDLSTKLFDTSFLLCYNSQTIYGFAHPERLGD